MTIIEKIKFLIKARKPVENLIAEVSQVKSGWKTSEFWLTVLSNLITVAGALGGVIDPKTAAIIMAVLNGLYSILRTIAKAGDGVVVTDVSTTPITPPQS